MSVLLVRIEQVYCVHLFQEHDALHGDTTHILQYCSSSNEFIDVHCVCTEKTCLVGLKVNSSKNLFLTYIIWKILRPKTKI